MTLKVPVPKHGPAQPQKKPKKSAFLVHIREPETHAVKKAYFESQAAVDLYLDKLLARGWTLIKVVRVKPLPASSSSPKPKPKRQIQSLVHGGLPTLGKRH